MAGKKKLSAAPSENERLDAIKRLVVIAMFSDDVLMERFVLKGGNALDLIHGISKRASVDVDLSINDDIAKEEQPQFRKTLERVLEETFRPEGYRVFDVTLVEKPKMLTADLADFWGGYEVQFKLIEEAKFDQFSSDLEALRRNALRLGEGAKFRIDISKFEYTADKQPENLDGFRIFVYSPEMIVCEKLRAICQQMKEYGPVIKRTRESTARAADFVDIHAVIENFSIVMNTEKNRELLSHIFSAKKVPLELLDKLPEYREHHEQDFPRVLATVKRGQKLNDFGFYFDYVVMLAQALRESAKQIRRS